MFYTETNRPGRIVQPKSTGIEPEYEERVDTKTGKKYLKKTGETNVYEKVQAAAEGTSLKEIIKRYGIDPTSNATSVQEFMKANVIDYTQEPKNLMEALEIINGAKNTFENSSKEIKQAFNNNFTEFLASSQNGNLEKVLESFAPKKETVIEEQTKVDLQPKQETTTVTGVNYNA